MTKRKCEAVTGLAVEQEGRKTWQALEANGAVYATAIGYNEGKTLYLLAEAVFHKRVRELLMEVGFKCQECGSFGPLHGHHVKHRSQGGTHAKSNIRILCDACHDKAHGIRRG